MSSTKREALLKTPAYPFVEAAHYLHIPLADRFKAGDTLTDLAKDYGAQPKAIEEAIRCEFDRRQAA